MFYFSWMPQRAPFDPEIHRRTDLEILSCHIEHREGCVAVLRLEVPQQALEGLFQSTVRWGMLSYQQAAEHPIAPLFCGLLTRIPELSPAQTCFLEFYGLPENLEEEIRKLRDTLKSTAHLDGLFEKKDAEQHGLFEGIAALPHWDRLTGDLTISDLLQGRHTLDVHDIFEKTLALERSRMPLKSVTLIASAEWIQSAAGETEIAAEILGKTQNGTLETYTPQSLARHWWRPGETLGQSTYRVAHTELALVREETVPSPVGELTKATFEPTLRLAWTLRQKRRETLRLTLSGSTEVHGPVGRSEVIHLQLQDILEDNETSPWRPNMAYEAGTHVKVGAGSYVCTHAHTSRRAISQDRPFWTSLPEDQSALGAATRASFFTRSRGRQAALHLLERAKAYMLMSTRTLRVTFEMPFDAALPISCDTSIRFQHTFFGNQSVEGKVSAYRLCIRENGARYAWVELLCAPPKARALKDVTLPPLEHLIPQSGILVPESLSAQDLVEDVQISNDAIIQEQWAQDEDALRKLAQNPTQISFFLAPLGTKRCLEHTIDLHITPEPAA